MGFVIHPLPPSRVVHGAVRPTVRNFQTRHQQATHATGMLVYQRQAAVTIQNRTRAPRPFIPPPRPASPHRSSDPQLRPGSVRFPPPLPGRPPWRARPVRHRGPMSPAAKDTCRGRHVVRILCDVAAGIQLHAEIPPGCAPSAGRQNPWPAGSGRPAPRTPSRPFPSSPDVRPCRSSIPPPPRAVPSRGRPCRSVPSG